LIDLLLETTVERLEIDDNGRTVQRAALVSSSGGRFAATAETFVLACGAIENARLLLSSPDADGCPLGNRHDNVGRYFMDHLSVDSGLLVPMHGGTISAEVFSARQAPDGGRYQPMLWLGDELIERAGLLNAAFWVEEIDPRYLAPGVGAARRVRAAWHGRPRHGLWRASARAAAGTPDLLAYAAGRIRRSARRVVAMRILTEQAPNRRSRVRLSSRRDRLGRRRVDIEWKVTDSDLDVIDAHQSVLGGLLEERGVARLTHRFDRRSHPSPIMSNFHHLGTTRMHRDARLGVVDADGAIHSMTNVYVTGGSVFPTGGYLNPTLTIIALAARLADTIARRSSPAVLSLPTRS
jgi:choline dehydrogenase-like flavoprotein